MTSLAMRTKTSSILVTTLCAWLLGGLSFSAWASQTIYQCGQEITNQPHDPKLCQALRISQPTQIEGTRVQQVPTPTLKSAPSGGWSSPAPQPSGVGFDLSQSSGDASNRQVQMRTILEDEWQKLSVQYAELVRRSGGGQAAASAGEAKHASGDAQGAQDIKDQLQRLARDMQALQRELNRYGKPVPTLNSK